MKMNRIVILLTLFISLNCYGQETNEIKFTYENFEKEFLKYLPTQKEGVSDKSFSFGQMVVSETKKQVENNISKFNVADYWNIVTAFYSLKESKDVWSIAFKKMAESDGSCEYLKSFKDRARFYEDIKELYDEYLIKCTQNLANSDNVKFDLDKYIDKNKLNNGLVKLIQKIKLDDQKYRKADEKIFKLKQPELDKKNEILIDSLYSKYKTYIGKSLVGERFNSVMWAVIQHSNLEMMEKFLPIIHKAVESKELNNTTLKMLLDRVYWLKYNYQIFGSQQGIDIADEKIRQQVIKKYGIE